MVLSMDRWIGKVAVVTGASSGIGAVTAEKLVELGLKVVGLARRIDRLEVIGAKLEGKKGTFYPLKADITKEQDVLEAFEWIKKNLGPVHILINNAGIGRESNLANGDTQAWKDTFQVNVIGLCVATREAVKDMKANNVDGHIIHINSIAGHAVPNFPAANVYPSSKFAVTALAETLRLELNSQKSKIKITDLSPGFISTEMLRPRFIPLKETFRKEHKILEAEQIADGIVYALSTPPHVQIQELTIRPIFDLP